ncbi:MAG: TrmH family RNA methyltransferase [Fidelibacterota bacterium]
MTLSHNKLKQLRALHQKKYRDLQGRYLAEGRRTVSEMLLASGPVEEILLREGPDTTMKDLAVQAEKAGITVHCMNGKTYDRITRTTHPAGIAAVCRVVPGTSNREGNWIYLDRISDPGNAGTILRTAVWFGCTNMAFSPASVDAYNPKVVRAAMGAHARCNIVEQTSWQDLPVTTILAADMSGTPVEESPLPAEPWMLVLGSEAHGLSPELKQVATMQVAIPRRGQGESLNVSVAAGILLYRLCKV